MTKQEYAAERLDPRWQKKRLEIMQRDGFKCVHCWGAENTLHVHHAYYVKGRKCWDYPDFALQTTCDDCHKETHAPREKDPDEIQSDITEWEIEMDWLLQGDGSNASPFWDIAGTIASKFKEGFSYSDIICALVSLQKQNAP